ncbi:hypothetical protein HPB47_002195 [Ixodes persulcatus]|uniref:Uncharacterized protein n=1 Tax=Ixodes persulcatus TaxID=34615 RepID=A0AC60PLW5_IXOPE|nr:hypothetical protein HPB47_002195 [Ixodes persulcatus]
MPTATSTPLNAETGLWDHCVRCAAMKRASLVAFIGTTPGESQCPREVYLDSLPGLPGSTHKGPIRAAQMDFHWILTYMEAPRDRDIAACSDWVSSLANSGAADCTCFCELKRMDGFHFCPEELTKLLRMKVLVVQVRALEPGWLGLTKIPAPERARLLALYGVNIVLHIIQTSA